MCISISYVSKNIFHYIAEKQDLHNMLVYSCFKRTIISNKKHVVNNITLQEGPVWVPYATIYKIN